MRLYISGPMTSIPNSNTSAFNTAEKKLRSAGHFPISPIALDVLHGDDYEKEAKTGVWESERRIEYLKRDLKFILSAEDPIDGIYMLQGWEKSDGAKLEKEVASGVGLSVHYEGKHGLLPLHLCTTASSFIANADWPAMAAGDEWHAERADIMARFTAELGKPTGDGSKKRRCGSKPLWYEDTSHEAAIFSHLMKWKKGETPDPESGAHPLVHLAWRCLAIACIESGNFPERRQKRCA